MSSSSSRSSTEAPSAEKFCQYVRRDGTRCNVGGDRVKDGRCNVHFASRQRVKCSFPGCNEYTASVKGQCTGHIPVKPEIDLTSVVVERICNFKTKAGKACDKPCYPDSLRCATHYSSTIRTPCIYEEEDGTKCGVITTSRHGYCVIHAAKLHIHRRRPKGQLPVSPTTPGYSSPESISVSIET